MSTPELKKLLDAYEAAHAASILTEVSSSAAARSSLEELFAKMEADAEAMYEAMRELLTSEQIGMLQSMARLKIIQSRRRLSSPPSSETQK